MLSLTSKELAQFEAKVAEITKAQASILDASFNADYQACFNAETKELDAELFEATRAERFKVEELVREQNNIKLDNLNVAIAECKKQIAIAAAFSYIN